MKNTIMYSRLICELLSELDCIVYKTNMRKLDENRTYMFCVERCLSKVLHYSDNKANCLATFVKQHPLLYSISLSCSVATSQVD